MSKYLLSYFLMKLLIKLIKMRVLDREEKIDFSIIGLLKLINFCQKDYFSLITKGTYVRTEVRSNRNFVICLFDFMYIVLLE